MMYPLGARPDTPDPQDYRYHARRAAAKAAAGERLLPVRIDNRDECTAVRRQLHSDCVGQAVASIAEFLYWRHYGFPPSLSSWAVYRIAQLNDAWPGEEPESEGTDLRTALKEAWAKHGMYPANTWPDGADAPVMQGAAAMARKYPLRRYEKLHGLWETKHAIHASGAVLMTAMVTAGWDAPVNGIIQPSMDELGYHAYMSPGYIDGLGFIVKNSWGPDWGIDGYAFLPYPDFERNVTDVWLPAIRNGGLWAKIAGWFR